MGLPPTSLPPISIYLLALNQAVQNRPTIHIQMKLITKFGTTWQFVMTPAFCFICLVFISLYFYPFSVLSLSKTICYSLCFYYISRIEIRGTTFCLRGECKTAFLLFGLVKARLKLSQRQSLNSLSTHSPRPPPTRKTIEALTGNL
jgi:hypothetical protein